MNSDDMKVMQLTTFLILSGGVAYDDLKDLSLEELETMCDSLGDYKTEKLSLNE